MIRAGWAGSTITAAWPGLHDRAYGIAFDVGSTTVAGHLCDLSTGEVLATAGMMNPQIRFGEDLMSRVSYVMMNPGGDADMTRVVRDAINGLAASVAAEAAIDIKDILEATFVGNPIMHHLLLGLDPTELGGAPFALTIDEAVRRRASELGLRLWDELWAAGREHGLVAGGYKLKSATAVDQFKYTSHVEVVAVFVR